MNLYKAVIALINIIYYPYCIYYLLYFLYLLFIILLVFLLRLWDCGDCHARADSFTGGVARTGETYTKVRDLYCVSKWVRLITNGQWHNCWTFWYQISVRFGSLYPLLNIWNLNIIYELMKIISDNFPLTKKTKKTSTVIGWNLKTLRVRIVSTGTSILMKLFKTLFCH